MPIKESNSLHGSLSENLQNHIRLGEAYGGGVAGGTHKVLDYCSTISFIANVPVKFFM